MRETGNSELRVAARAERQGGGAPGSPPTASPTKDRRRGGPPLPHEHGAWVILYAPLIAGFALAPRHPLIPFLLLLLAVTAAFLARHAASLLLRQRGREETRPWLGLYLVHAGAGGLPLVLGYHRYAMIGLGVLAGLLFLAHSALQVLPARKRMDRSQWGEVLGVAGLTLTAPASYAAASGRLDPSAWLAWITCLLYFSGGIFYVKMLLGSARYRNGLDLRTRLKVSRDCLAYHLLLVPIVLGMASTVGPWRGLLLVCAFLPALVRAIHGAATLSGRLPSLKRVGVTETVYALWFTMLFIAARC